ncbi:MAG: hypothetical protein ACJ8FY_28270 [Gemmataceae bacterium]
MRWTALHGNSKSNRHFKITIAALGIDGSNGCKATLSWIDQLYEK